MSIPQSHKSQLEKIRKIILKKKTPETSKNWLRSLQPTTQTIGIWTQQQNLHNTLQKIHQKSTTYNAKRR